MSSIFSNSPKIGDNLFAAIENNDLKKVKKICGNKKNAKLLSDFDEQGFSVLTAAIKNGNYEIFCQILSFYKLCKQDINQLDRTGIFFNFST